MEDTRRFQTESKRNYYGKHSQMNVNNNPYESALKERRQYDICHVQAIVKASDKKILNERKYNRDHMEEVAEASKRLYNEDEYILTPCRYAASGWKYVKKV